MQPMKNDVKVLDLNQGLVQRFINEYESYFTRYHFKSSAHGQVSY